MRFTDHTQIKKGLEVFYVHAFPALHPQSYICKYRFVDDPKMHKTINSRFIDAQPLELDPANGNHHTSVYDFNTGIFTHHTHFHLPVRTLSLSDAGVNQPQHYNEHALFDNLIEAENYIIGLLGSLGNPPGQIQVNNKDPLPAIVTSDDDNWDRAMGGI